MFGRQMLLVVIAVLWIAFLAPILMRARIANRQQPDFSDFYASLSQLGRQPTSYGTSDDPRIRRRQALARKRTAERRRRVFNTLGGSATFLLVAAMLGNSSMLWALFGVAMLLLVAYVGLLVAIARAARPIQNLGAVQYRSGAMVPEFALQRSGRS